MRPLLLAFDQLPDPAFTGTVFRSVLWSALAFAALAAGSVWGVHELVARALASGWGWLGWLAGALGGIGAAVLSLWLFVPAAVLIATLYVERIAAAVERRHYPGLPRPDGAPLTEQFWDGIVLGLQLVPLQVLTLILTLVLPGVGLVLGLCITGWALGRGLFVAVAMRRMGRQEAVALFSARRGAALLPGIALAGLGLVPLANLLVPVLGIAAMVHVLQGPGLMQPRLGLSRRSGP